MTNQILIIAGIDPTGHAGLLRDIQVCNLLKQQYIAFPTALTVQTDKKFMGAATPDKEYFENLWSSLEKTKISAVKIGMLTNASLVSFIAQSLKKLKRRKKSIKIVWDPLIKSTSGGILLDKQGLNKAIKELLPLVDIITPNGIEACELAQIPYSRNIDPKTVCLRFYKLFQRPLYLKGGHFREKSTDYFYNGRNLKVYPAKPSRKKIRGTGCIHSTALACYLSQGESLAKACEKSKKFMVKTFAGNLF